MTEHNVFRLIVVQRSFQQKTDISITKHNLTTSYIMCICLLPGVAWEANAHQNGDIVELQKNIYNLNVC